MRISDWSSDVCSSDLAAQQRQRSVHDEGRDARPHLGIVLGESLLGDAGVLPVEPVGMGEPDCGRRLPGRLAFRRGGGLAHHFLGRLVIAQAAIGGVPDGRSEEHTSELQSLMRISYAVFCLKKKKTSRQYTNNNKYQT